MSEASTRLIASLQRDSAALDLKTVDLCFLVALHARASTSALTGFEEDVLIDVFEQVCEVVEPGAENLRKRATHSIQRLREQRLLSRVDAAGVMRAGEYAMTSLASGIVQFFLRDEALTRESLTLLTKTLLTSLADIKSAAKRAHTEDAWRTEVIAPIRVTVGDLVAGIERRQRGLDVQQEEVQRKIGELLQADWFDAVDRCQDLLDDTTSTLAELNTVLLHDSNQIQMMLQDIEQLASGSGVHEAEEALARVEEQVDRVAAWGSARQRAWSEYYQYVHRFLRDVVRLDPSRALSERLRNQLSGWVHAPFAVVVSGAKPMRLLRELEQRVERPAVTRQRRDREASLEEVAFDVAPSELEDRVRAALAKRPQTLSHVVREVLPEVPDARRFIAVGRIAAQVVAEAQPKSDRERPWVAVSGDIEVEDWQLEKGDGR
jgi:chromosome partition protein MukF